VVHLVSVPPYGDWTRFLARAIELLVESGHLTIDWTAAQPGDFQPRSYHDLGMLGTALTLAADGALPGDLQQLLQAWITDTLVIRGRALMRQHHDRVPTPVELQDLRVTQLEISRVSHRSRSRLATRINEESHTTFRAMYRACVERASHDAHAILASEQQRPERDLAVG
jgi:hypothetical protein